MGFWWRLWEWLPRISFQPKPLSPRRQTIVNRRIGETMAMMKAGCWLDRVSYEGLGLTGPLTTVEIYRRSEDGLLIPNFSSLIEWTGENVEGQIVYEVIDDHKEAGSHTIQVKHNGGFYTHRIPRYDRIGCRHVFQFTDPDSAFAFKMRWV